eukprot:TRINITY_DN1681_c0_g1_i2.p1 TRINITY_DN1681_c0_g1~~TRINITY_DN1681_c0_g1_i2.p1  ORF type:complete len:386 (+),score=52.98 TRINITY_DN1681_c0_g1_i2:133-1158(+)
MAKGRDYTFQEGNSAIFTWESAKVEVQGDYHAYIADDTPMIQYLNIHHILQGQRQQAKESGGVGPRVMVCGSQDSGKKSLCKLLVNYAARLGESVTYVDLDIGLGSITVPGTVSAIPVDKPIDMDDGFGLAAPMTFYFGDVTANQNPKLYSMQVQRLAAVVNKRNEVNLQARSAGTIINTMGWSDKSGYQLLLESIEIFQPTVVLVIANPRLYNDLKLELEKTNPQARVEKLNKSEGVVARDATARRKAHTQRIKEYFYGKMGDLSPYSTVIHFRDFKVLKTNVGPQAPSTALPIGSKSAVDLLKPREVAPSVEMLQPASFSCPAMPTAPRKGKISYLYKL